LRAHTAFAQIRFPAIRPICGSSRLDQPGGGLSDASPSARKEDRHAFKDFRGFLALLEARAALRYTTG
jgi:hypothetical protein